MTKGRCRRGVIFDVFGVKHDANRFTSKIIPSCKDGDGKLKWESISLSTFPVYLVIVRARYFGTLGEEKKENLRTAWLIQDYFQLYTGRWFYFEGCIDDVYNWEVRI